MTGKRSLLLVLAIAALVGCKSSEPSQQELANSQKAESEAQSQAPEMVK